MRKLALTMAFVCFPGAALAQTYSVEPGLWETQGSGLLSGIEMPVDGTECIAPEDAEIDVRTLMQSAGETSCMFDHANGRDFTLSCSGEMVISASGELEVNRRSVVVDAAGTVVMEGLGDVPVSIKASAKHIGDC